VKKAINASTKILEQRNKKKNRGSRNNQKLQGKMVLSIDIGQHTTKLILGKAGKESVEVKRACMFRTPIGCLENGRILDSGKLENRLIEAIKSNNLKVKYVFCTVENAEIVTREIILPTADEDALQNMIQIEVQQCMPIDLDNYLIQSKILDTFDDNGTNKTRFLSTAVPKDLVQSYYDLLQKLDIKAAVLDIQSNSIDKLACLELNLIPKDQTIAIVDFGYSHINVVLIENGKYQFNRYIGLGASNIDRQLMSFLNYSEEEIEQKKMTGIFSDAFSGELHESSITDEQDTLRATNIIRNFVDNWIDELGLVFKYYTNKSKGRAIQKILIHGGMAQMEGFDSYLAREFGVPVEYIQKLSSRPFQTNNVQNVTQYLNAVGALIRR